jgi:methionine aminopeptidase
MIVRKNMAELEKMRAAGLLVWKILDALKKMVARASRRTNWKSPPKR